MKQDLQLLLPKVFHLINVSCSILNTSLMHFYEARRRVGLSEADRAGKKTGRVSRPGRGVRRV